MTDQLSIGGGGQVTISRDPAEDDVLAEGVTDVAASTDGADASVAADNAGPVQTVALKSDASNPAMDASGADAPDADVRGQAVSIFAGVNTGQGFGSRDLGAFELGGVPAGPAPDTDPEPEEKSLVVTTTADVVDAFDGVTSLREAVTFANKRDEASTITFAEGGQGLVRLTEGALIVTDTLEVDGAGKVTITGDADNNDFTILGDITDVSASVAGADLLFDNSRIFEAADATGGGSLVLTGLTLTGGRPGDDPSSAGDGGAILGIGVDIFVRNSALVGNSTGPSGMSGGETDDGGAV